jgi:hypothetical protein
MIYGVIEEGHPEFVKIGLTHTIGGAISTEHASKRLSSMQTGTWRTLVCIAVAPGNREVERDLHEAFYPHHVRGEWYRCAGEVAAWVSAHSIDAELTQRPRAEKKPYDRNKYRGHIGTDAPPRLSDGAVSGLGRCRLCRVQGHTARNCPRLAKVIENSIRTRQQKKPAVIRTTLISKATNTATGNDNAQASLPFASKSFK